MGRYGIGARVRDRDGDEGVIVGKPDKGFRTVRYTDGLISGMTLEWSKAELTPIACAEKGEVAFSVGDRVVFISENTGHGAVYYDGVLTVDGVGDDGVRVSYPPFGSWTDNLLTQTTTAESLAKFTLEAGKTYRTRDGRKVGPMVAGAGNCVESAMGGKQIAAFHDEEQGSYTVDGTWLTSDGDAYEDIVGFWTEPEAATTITAVATEPIKVGDLVRYVGKYAEYNEPEYIGSEGVVTAVLSETVAVDWTKKRVGGPSHAVFTENVEVIAADPAPAPTLTLEAGKFYRTRDGRKVGPMERSLSEWTTQDGTNRLWNDDGTRWSLGHEHTDLVAEWVEPEVVTKFDFKVGDKVLLRSGGVAEIIEAPTEDGSYPFVHDRGTRDYHACTADGKSCISEDGMDVVGLAKPQPKFKVTAGKRYRGKSGAEYDVVDNSDNECWPLTNAAFDRFWKVDGTAYNERGWNEGCPTADDLVAEVAKPAIPVGTKVILTATVTGNNPADRSNVQIVVDGLPPGRNSIGITPAALKLAA